ncbi:hypothetical protein ACHAW5_008268 [Stephanodiscus triporus]|uniref:WW domain-containing protein n=1 Tax=Stephanodiscus triporus TaxID=2934178 RepID=A0ABD3MRZ2_9STRA
MTLNDDEDDLTNEVLQYIHDRETLIERLEKFHAQKANGRCSRVPKLLYGIHNASLGVVEAIAAWNLGKQDDWCRKKNIDTHYCGPFPFNTFFWNGQNYLQKMISDLDFVGDMTQAISFLGPTPFHRNPFLLPLDIDHLAWGSNVIVESKVWKDVNPARIRRLAFVILLDEYNRNRRPSGGSNADSWKFYPPQLTFDDFSSYTKMTDPPATVAIAVCCAHLILGSLDVDITDKLNQLTKTIVLHIFRQPLNGLLHKVRVYNPLRQAEVNKSIIKLVHPFVMIEKMDSWADDASDQIVRLSKWTKALVLRLAEEEICSSKALTSAGRIFRELEADNQRGIPRADSSRRRMCHEAKNENETKNESIQTEGTSPSQSQCLDKTDLGVVCETRLIPYPVPITVNLIEGSQVAEINGRLDELSMLKTADVLRICDAHESSDWIISEPPIANADGSMALRLATAYDHSRISAQEKTAKFNALNRLCYPYKRDEEGANYNGLERQFMTVECTRHVASDANEIIHSPLQIKEARIWKLVPEEEDTRAAWRREFDDGGIPYRNDYCGRRDSVTHFRVRVSLDNIERSCIDFPYPLYQCVHQQRVSFFESIPLADVIGESFNAVCRWHPQGSLIDNVKWAKLCRKMNFLSNMKNPKHEIDMSFLRKSENRKLDLSQFHAILEDIASTQHPALAIEDALHKVVWASIVMLPDVNSMMWKEAKRMAIHVEVRRVCAQTRISALARKNREQAKYTNKKEAAVTISKYVRQYLARVLVSKILHALRQDEEYKRRTKCATVVQTAWRRSYWRSRFIMHQERMIKARREQIAATRAKFREERQRKHASIVLREVIQLDSTIAIVTISFRDEHILHGDIFIQIQVYVPSTKETFAFNIEECALRECLEKAVSSEGRLSWNEMLKESVLSELLKRLMLRVVRGRPIFLFCKRNIVEKGLLVDKRVVRAAGELFILSTFRSPHEFVFCTYQSSNRLQMRTKLSVVKLREWISETNHNSSSIHGTQSEQSGDGNACILDQRNQTELIEWLLKRVVIQKNPQGENMQLRLQFEAEAERIVNLVIKVQAQWRRLKSLRCAKEKATQQYEKIFVRDNNAFAYRNIRTNERQWEKPKLLGKDDLSDPLDQWRRESTFDRTTGEEQHYYANYATGQSSWLSVEDAARMIQRRYRSKHESDLVGTKITLPDTVKAMKFIHGARAKYDQEPNKLSNIVNYALLVHCVDLDFSKARPIYQKALEQSPNHPLISRAYGIFLLASRQTPPVATFQTACRLFQEANVVDPTQAKFQSAAEIYFRWAVLVNPRNPLALLNYALLNQCIYRTFDKAEKVYRAALSVDPTNTLVSENYLLFTDERYLGGAYVSIGPPYSVVRRSHVCEERPELAEWSKMIDPECHKKGGEVFWYNRFTKETRFEAPSPKEIWDKRLSRSTIVSGKTSNWVEYFDKRTQTSFFYDLYTKEYTCVRG